MLKGSDLPVEISWMHLLHELKVVQEGLRRLKTGERGV